MNWTSSEISALAPDAATENRARRLAQAPKWEELGQYKNCIWGYCKGAGIGSMAYEVKIYLKGPELLCNCAQRQAHCKHALALLFLFVESPRLFRQKTPPHNILNWYLQQQPQNSPTTASPLDPKELEKKRLAKAKRQAKKLEQMEAGMEELEQWLQDFSRQGFAQLPVQDKIFWEQLAQKMTDAKMSRLAYGLRETAQLLPYQSNWMDFLGQKIGELQLLLQSFKQRDKLSPLQLEDLLDALGRVQRKKDIVAQNKPIQDQWLVLALLEEVDAEGRNMRRVWLQGLQTGKNALLIDYSFGSRGFEQNYFLGQLLEAALYYYPSAYPQRAILQEQQQSTQKGPFQIQMAENWQAAQKQYAQALGKNPWLNYQLFLVQNLQLQQQADESFILLDQNGQYLPFQTKIEQSLWRILAYAAEANIHLIGEWQNGQFRPLSIFKQGQPQAL